MFPIGLFFVGISFALIDSLFREGWPDYYFRIGIPVMYRQMKFAASWTAFSAQRLTKYPWPTINTYSRFTFYEIAEGVHGVMYAPLVRTRRFSHQSPLFHGTIQVDQAAQIVTMAVRLKLFATGVTIVMVGLGLIISMSTQVGVLWLLLVCVILIKLFIDELQLYRRLWAALESFFREGHDLPTM